MLMSAIPNGEGSRLLRWETANKIPWGVLLLFAGGIAIANAFVQSGLADIIAGEMEAIVQLPTWLLILSICLTVTFLTEVTPLSDAGTGPQKESREAGRAVGWEGWW